MNSVSKWLLFILTLNTNPGVVNLMAQSNWYQMVPADIDDPYSFNSNFFMLYQKGLTLEGHISSGYYYAKLNQKEFDHLWQRDGHEEILERISISESNKKVFSDHFKRSGKELQIPFVVALTLEELHFIANASLKILEYVNRSREEFRTSAQQLSALIASGGIIERTQILFTKSGAPMQYYISLITSYNVRVGTEDRHYILSRATLAVKIE